jgi:hypothetical protein
LFRGELPGLVELPLNQHIAKLTRTPRRIQTGTEDLDFAFIALSYTETTSRHNSGSPAMTFSHSPFSQPVSDHRRNGVTCHLTKWLTGVRFLRVRVQRRVR